MQLCRARGAIPYAIVGRGKEQAVREIGAEAVITREAGALGEQVHIATRGQPIDVVADLVAGAMFGELINILRPEGRYTTAGAIGGPVVTLDLRTVYLKHLQLHGSSQGTRSAFRRLHRHIEEEGEAAAVADLSTVANKEAQTAFMAKQFVGKLVMQPDRLWTPLEGAASLRSLKPR